LKGFKRPFGSRSSGSSGAFSRILGAPATVITLEGVLFFNRSVRRFVRRKWLR
jgi:hypothetical protein